MVIRRVRRWVRRRVRTTLFKIRYEIIDQGLDLRRSGLLKREAPQFGQQYAADATRVNGLGRLPGQLEKVRLPPDPVTPQKGPDQQFVGVEVNDGEGGGSRFPVRASRR